MKEIPHRRIWIGKDAASQGLVDAIGGISRAIAIAKFKANIPQNKQVNLVELSRSGPSLRILLRGIGYALVGDPRLLNQLLEDNDGTIPAYMKNDTSLSEVEEDTSFVYHLGGKIKFIYYYFKFYAVDVFFPAFLYCFSL
ncbi:putative ClpP/crotonase-like domain-containing protein [Medicago truncatula]|uniref:Putative ClpP/crotonase-like domain-containing protein n=1 Tax=Medicago truncatula TaxID=3880 RepID=A0A396HPS0_MEDTR|nr:putative ClpP/crotonase-like domain-containing protein [Medicago truncatula]